MAFDDLDEFDEKSSSNPCDNKNLVIFDSLNYMFKYKHKGITNFSSQFLTDVRSFAKSYNAKQVILLGDCKGSKWRKSIYPEYKANRDKLKEAQTEEDSQAFKLFIEEYLKTIDLASNHFLTIVEEGIEADDLAGFIAKNFKDHFDNIWLISTDKDWDLLVEDNIKRFSYITRKEYREDNWDEVYEYPHDIRLDVKVLQGDTGDNIKGIPGIGPKRAVTLLNEYGSVMDIYDSLPLPGKQKFIQELNANKELIPLNIDLIDVYSNCEQAISFVSRDLLDIIYNKVVEDLSVRN